MSIVISTVLIPLHTYPLSYGPQSKHHRRRHPHCQSHFHFLGHHQLFCLMDLHIKCLKWYCIYRIHYMQGLATRTPSRRACFCRGTIAA